MRIGALCRTITNKDVAELEGLHDSTVKKLDKIYMEKQVAKAGLPAPRVIGVDEISIRKGHDYRIIVSDLDRSRPIWVGGRGRSEADLDLFFQELGERKARRIKLAPTLLTRLRAYRMAQGRPGDGEVVVGPLPW